MKTKITFTFLLLLLLNVTACSSTVNLRDFEHLMTDKERDRIFGVVLVYGDSDINYEQARDVILEDEYSCLVQHTFTI